MGEDAIKWIVLGGIVLAFLLIFRSEIKGLLRRATQLEISKSGLKIIAIDTPLGKTTISAIRAADAQPPEQKSDTGIETFVSKQYCFQISWHKNSGWVASSQLTKQQVSALADSLGFSDTVPLPTFLILKGEPQRGTPPIVIVDVQPNEYRSISDLFERHIHYVTSQQGVGIISSKVDRDTNAALVTLHDETYAWTTVTKLIIAGSFFYRVSAIQIPPGEAYSDVRNESNFILNSFRLLL